MELEKGLFIMSGPVKKFRLGSVTASIWKNGEYHSVTLERTYKDGEELKNTGNLNPGDLLNAARLLNRCEEFLAT